MNKIPKIIAIYGIGLIGGSITMGLKRHYGNKIRIYGLCANKNRTKKAVKNKIIDGMITKQVLKKIRLIILAAPILTNMKILERLAKISLPGTIIMDMGSTKNMICQKANKLIGNNISFIGTHPMTGTEKSGFENATPDLFKDRSWIICTNKNNQSKDINTTIEIIRILKGKPLIVRAIKHDQSVAKISHLPALLAVALINNVFSVEKNQINKKLASFGFHDTTRLASQNVKMFLDIIKTNRQEILTNLRCFAKELMFIENQLINNNYQEIEKCLSKAKNLRDHWIKKYFFDNNIHDRE